jgi:hypothetical protein
VKDEGLLTWRDMASDQYLGGESLEASEGSIQILTGSIIFLLTSKGGSCRLSQLKYLRESQAAKVALTS